MRNSVFARSIVPAFVALLIAGGSAQAQEAKDSVAGKWQTSKNMTTGGTLHIVLDLKQSGDSLSGLASMELNGMPSEAPVEIVGTIHDGNVDLKARYGEAKFNGKLRKNDMRLRVVPGRYEEGRAYEMTFQRLP